MAQGQTYKKYGGFAAPDMKSMVAGQAAVGDSIKEAFSGVEDLLKKTEESYRETNTLNMQEYLKGQLKQQGLGADPLDKTAIKQQFGSLINMDQLDAGYQEEKQRMELDAANLVGQEADQLYTNTGDEVQARQFIDKRLSELNATKSFKDKVLQSWTDSNATRFADQKTMELEGDNVLIDTFDSRLKESGISAAPVIMTALLADTPEKDRPEKRKLLEERLLARQEMTEESQFAFDNNLQEYDTITQSTDLKYEQQIQDLLSKQSALSERSGIPEGTYNQLDNATEDFGDDVINAISTELGWFNGGDVKEFNSMLNNLVEKQGIPERDAAGMITHVFGRVYDGGSWHGNNVSPQEISKAKIMLNTLASNYNESKRVGNDITRLRSEAAAVRLKRAQGKTQLAREMRLAAQNRNVGHSGGIQEYLRSKVNQDPIPVDTTAFDAQAQAQGQAQGQAQADPNAVPASPEEEKDAIAQRLINMQNNEMDSALANISPDSEANDVTNLNSAIKRVEQRRRGQNINPPVAATPDAEAGSLQDIQGRIANSGLSDNPINRAVTGAADSTFDFVKQYSLPGMAANLGQRFSDGINSLRDLSRNRYAGLAENIRSSNPLSNEEMAAQTQDPVKWTAQNRKVDSKAKSGNLALTDLTGDIRMTPAINESIAKMPSHSEAIQQQANKIKSLKKNEQTRIIEALWLANPELAKGIADLLGIS